MRARCRGIHSGPSAVAGPRNPTHLIHLMLVFTNRDIAPGSAASAFTRSFQPGGTRLAMAEVTTSGNGWKLQNIDDDVSQKDALDRLLSMPDETPKAVYPQRCEPDGSVCYVAVPKQGDQA